MLCNRRSIRRCLALMLVLALPLCAACAQEQTLPSAGVRDQTVRVYLSRLNLTDRMDLSLVSAYSVNTQQGAQLHFQAGSEVAVLLRDAAAVGIDTGARNAVRQRYEAVCEARTEAPQAVPCAEAATLLDSMSECLKSHLCRTEFVTDGAGQRWMNSYYDNNGAQVEGLHAGRVRIMLTGQVFALMSGTAEGEQTQGIVRAVAGDALRATAAENLKDAVEQMQEQLNAISNNYPLIPRIAVDGIYGEDTQKAVEVFQDIFNLPVTGIVDYRTWYKIQEIYVAVSRIAELR